MLIRRIARPLLSIAFIGQGVDSLLNPKSARKPRRPPWAVCGRYRIRLAAAF